MADQPSNRLAALRKRYEQTAVEPEEAAAAARKIAAAAPGGRRRTSLFLSHAALLELDAAYRREASSLYLEQQVEVLKAEYLEACIDIALMHPDEVRARLLERRQKG